MFVTMTGARAKKTVHIDIKGVVQGVGFRPFVYRLAHKHNLPGWVRNTSAGVEIEVEGTERALEGFVSGLRLEAPPVSVITGLEITPIPGNGCQSFEIRESLSEEGEYQLISPDIATCADCLKELFSPKDRRYRYPFINCTNCGPRFTIIEDIPYDRRLTTMRHFEMCPECRSEYMNPLDRRFHAEPNACPRCGPSLELMDSGGRIIHCADVIQTTGKLLKDEKIVALKGLGGFQLACDATNTGAVRLLRLRKKRPAKPFALMMASLDDVTRCCFVSKKEEKLLSSPQSPVVLLRRRERESGISPEVAPGLLYLGVMLPYTPLHHLLMKEASLPLVMTSGNLSEEPIAKDNNEALKRLSGIADYLLMHNRDIYARYDDSVYLVEKGEVRPIRRARGHAPYPVRLPFKVQQVFASGAEEKNTFCLTRDNYAFLSQHIGDMENEETLEHYENTLSLYERLLRIEPEVVAYDMHPEYLSTKYALSLRHQKPALKFVPVQHHHAHVVSCMAENGFSSPVIGVAFDGTGYGLDGAVWGGEFLLCDYGSFKRVGHLEYAPMPGGALAIRKPYRMALGYIYSLTEESSLEGLAILKGLESREVEIIKQQIEGRINAPLTSSIGRLFDGVSAIAGICGVINYEAQAAVLLEMLATPEIENGNHRPYPFSIEGGECKVVKLGELIRAIVNDTREGVPAPVVAARFHETVAEVIVRTCKMISEETRVRTVALSGGVFQNRLLLRLSLEKLENRGFRVLTHHLVPCNDGGLSLGQAVIGSFKSGRVD